MSYLELIKMHHQGLQGRLESLKAANASQDERLAAVESELSSLVDELRLDSGPVSQQTFLRCVELLAHLSRGHALSSSLSSPNEVCSNACSSP